GGEEEGVPILGHAAHSGGIVRVAVALPREPVQVEEGADTKDARQREPLRPIQGDEPPHEHDNRGASVGDSPDATGGCLADSLRHGGHGSLLEGAAVDSVSRGPYAGGMTSAAGRGEAPRRRRAPPYGVVSTTVSG